MAARSDWLSGWIKMRCNLDRDPKVWVIAETLAECKHFCNWLGHPVQVNVKHGFDHVSPSVTRDVTIASLLRVWSVAIERGKVDGDDVVMSPCGHFTIDEIAQVPGFGEAMEAVGWVVFDEERKARFPNFLVDNVPASERRKVQSKESSRRYREKKKGNRDETSGHGDVTSASPRDAKRDHREEKKTKSKSKSKSSVSGSIFDSLPDDISDLDLLWPWFCEATQHRGKPPSLKRSPQGFRKIVHAVEHCLRRNDADDSENPPSRLFKYLVGKEKLDELKDSDDLERADRRIQSWKAAKNGKR